MTSALSAETLPLDHSNLTLSADSVHGVGARDVGPSTTVYYTVASVLTFTLVTGTLFNTIAIAVFARNKQLRTPTNSFVIALCVCDLLLSLMGTPVPAITAWFQGALHGQTALCTVDGFVVYFFGLSSMYLLAAIAVDRYVVIVRGPASIVVTQGAASVAIGVCFALGLFWTSLPLLGWNRYVPEGIGVACSISWRSGDPTSTSYIITILVFCLVLPLIVMAFCYVSIYLTIRKISHHSPWGPNSHVAKNNHRVERKLLKTVIIMMGAYLVCWTPYTVVSLSQAFSRQPVVSPVVETIPALIAKCSAIWDPIIYIATNLQFRRAFFDVAPFCEVLLKSCGGETSSYESETALDAESCAVLDNGQGSGRRSTYNHVNKDLDRCSRTASDSSDTPRNTVVVGVRHENISLDVWLSKDGRV